MCYKVSTPTRDLLEEALGYGLDSMVEPHFFADGFTFPQLPVSLQGNPGAVRNMTWGLVPHWFDLEKAREKSIEAKIAKLTKAGKQFDISMVHADPDEKLIKAFQTNTLNAKSEEVFIKPSWKMSIMKKRCIVYTTGFYEWRHFDDGKVKIPYFIYPQQDKILRMGGIWAQWAHPETAEVYESFSIITTPANTLLSKIHNSKLRMPLLFGKDESALWLSNELEKDQVVSLMKPCHDEILKAHTVDNLISKQVPVELKNTPDSQKEVLYEDWIKD